jgi:hypothetical protein
MSGYTLSPIGTRGFANHKSLSKMEVFQQALEHSEQGNRKFRLRSSRDVR